MNVSFRIEQLILEAIDLAPGQRARLQAAVETELSSLLAASRLPSHLQNGGTFPKVSITIDLAGSPNPAQMGRSIAQSVYRQMAQAVPPSLVNRSTNLSTN